MTSSSLFLYFTKYFIKIIIFNVLIKIKEIHMPNKGDKKKPKQDKNKKGAVPVATPPKQSEPQKGAKR